MYRIGFNRCNIEYEARPRVAVKSKYSLRKLFKFSINTILCFRICRSWGIYSGMFVGFLGLIVMVDTIYEWAVHGTPNGYATIVVLLFYVRHAVCRCGIIGNILQSCLRNRKTGRFILSKIRKTFLQAAAAGR